MKLFGSYHFLVFDCPTPSFLMGWVIKLLHSIQRRKRCWRGGVMQRRDECRGHVSSLPVLVRTLHACRFPPSLAHRAWVFYVSARKYSSFTAERNPTKKHCPAAATAASILHVGYDGGRRKWRNRPRSRTPILYAPHETFRYYCHNSTANVARDIETRFSDHPLAAPSTSATIKSISQRSDGIAIMSSLYNVV